MNKLIKAIPEKHMAVINDRAGARRISTSSYIRELIRKEVELTDITLSKMSPAMSDKLKLNAAASGLTLNEYLFQVIANGGVI